jgi:hypothetical protein
MDYVVDGGYYDNYGAATLMDVLREVPKDQPLVIIQITSDPTITGRLEHGAGSKVTDSVCSDTSAAATEAEADERGPMGNLDSVYNAAMAARSRTGLVYATALRDSAKSLLESKPEFPKWVQFGMSPADLPLGWSLSSANRSCINQLLDDQTMKAKISRLIEVLKGP